MISTVGVSVSVSDDGSANSAWSGVHTVRVPCMHIAHLRKVLQDGLLEFRDIFLL